MIMTYALSSPPAIILRVSFFCFCSQPYLKEMIVDTSWRLNLTSSEDYM